MNIKKVCSRIVISLIMILLSFNGVTKNCSAEGIFQVSPMKQRITLTPGERYYGTFKITDPATSLYKFYYKTSISPFFVDDDFNVKFENNGDYNQIVDWITVENPTGIVEPNSTEIVKFYIDVPEDAPAGGQYATIKFESDHSASAEDGLNIQQTFAIGHTILAEVAGETNRGGIFDEIKVPGFMFNGNIKGTATITNTGNIHSDATFILRIFPLFSKEEIYTNEEDPTVSVILPGVSRSNVSEWKDTPKIGIFHVIYTAEFEGMTKAIDRHVIICPIWLLVIILAIIFLILFKILFTGKKEKK